MSEGERVHSLAVIMRTAPNVLMQGCNCIAAQGQCIEPQRFNALLTSIRSFFIYLSKQFRTKWSDHPRSPLLSSLPPSFFSLILLCLHLCNMIQQYPIMHFLLAQPLPPLLPLVMQTRRLVILSGVGATHQQYKSAQKFHYHKWRCFALSHIKKRLV